MAGMDVLDVGSATGFIAFEFEKRPLCRGTLIVTEHFLDEDEQAQPLMLYAGEATPALDRRTLW